MIIQEIKVKFMEMFEPINPSIDDIETMIELFKNALDISRVTSRILLNRGISDIKSAQIFLNPSMNNLFDPFRLKDMDKAVERIERAISTKEPITIYGDYDVDGMTSCALLYNFFQSKNCPVDVYIPNRQDEGYGINREAIEHIHKSGTQLIISVDCGITAVAEVELAKELGIDMIITDHHQCGSSLPEAIAVINPSRDPDLHREHPLAGVGVAGKLVQAIGGMKYLEEYLDLIALGTVADVVPLIGDNRILVAKGLDKIIQSPCPGIKALIEVSGYKDKKINTGNIAYGLAPRLNATGRIDNPLRGFELLTSKTLTQAMPLAKLLDQHNKHRQAIEMDTIREAEEMIEERVDLSSDRIIVLSKEGWNPGVIGIAASKITEQYYRPCILIAVEDGVGVGSARSIRDFSIYDALDSCSHLLEKFGGHEQAAGFKLAESNIDSLRQHLLDYCDKAIDDTMLIPKYSYDIDLKSDDITYDLVKELEALEPFGIGNPSPYFLLSNVRLETNRQVGKDGRHLMMSIELGHRLWDGIAFDMGQRSETLSAANRVSMVTGIEKNEWKGISKIQFNVKQIALSLSNSHDWDRFLSYFYLKKFDAFFRDFMYNKHYNSKINSLKPSSLKPVDIDDIMNKIDTTGIGSLILVNSLANSQRIAQYILKYGIAQKVAVSYGQPDKWNGIGTNAIILSPSYSTIAFADYKNIYIFEDEISFCQIDLGKIENSKIHKITNIDLQLDIKSRIDEDFFVQRVDFETIYKWLRSLNNGSRVWQGWIELLEDYQKHIGKNINGFKVRLMLKVFEELDFIRVESANRLVRIHYNIRPKRRDLQESPLYNYYIKWLRNIKQQQI
ncbi:MAG: single-stranded-DNA-specific exonuclease RecJ [Caldicoprobacterales bacterium]